MKDKEDNRKSRVYTFININLHEYCKMEKHCQRTNYKIMQLRTQRMEQGMQKLRIILHKRQRRGLLNVIGSVSKTLFGTI